MISFLTKLSLSAAITALAATSALAVELIMVEQKGCHYCEAWMEEIGPAYPKTPEGKFAPLVRRDISAGAPENSTFARRVNFTPTFILMDDGVELARIEGYPGDEFFWPLFSQLLETKTAFTSDVN